MLVIFCTSLSNGSSDYIYGDDGDNLIGNANGGRFYGGTGNDTFFSKATSASVEMYGEIGNDTLNGGSGYDIATYTGQYTRYGAVFASNGDVEITGGEGTDRLNGIERINFSNGFYNIYTGDQSNNTLTADPNVWSLLYGGNGNDTLTGGLYNDTLAGGSGNDALVAGNGNDYLNGYNQVDTITAERDRLTGGAGSDYFTLGERGRVFYAVSGNRDRALITDFDAKQNQTDTVFDQIVLSGNASQYRLQSFSISGIGTNAQDTEILFNKNNTWEQIGIIQDSTNINLNRDFVFV